MYGNCAYSSMELENPLLKQLDPSKKFHKSAEEDLKSTKENCQSTVEIVMEILKFPSRKFNIPVWKIFSGGCAKLPV
jgi:hypothetical protein